MTRCTGEGVDMSMVRGVVLTTLLLGVVGWRYAAAGGSTASHTDTGAHAVATTMGIARLRAHFDSVDIELRNVLLDTLRPSQRAGRVQVLAWLREYRNAGRFPDNDRFVASVPFFVDHRGVRCAMGELLHRSGRDDIVNDVRRTRNNAYIAELVDDPRLVVWLDSVGLTAGEAGRVQPAYDGLGGGNVIDDTAVPSSPRNYKLASGALGLVSLSTVWLNATRPTGLSKWIGLSTGTASVITGALGLQDDLPGRRGFATASMAVSTITLATAMYRMFAPVRRPVTGTVSSGMQRVQLFPTIVDAGDHRHQVGFALRASFR